MKQVSKQPVSEFPLQSVFLPMLRTLFGGGGIVEQILYGSPPTKVFTLHGGGTLYVV